MRTYVIFDCETGDVVYTLVSPGPIAVSAEVIEDLIESGRLQRAAFVEVDASRLPMRTVLDNGGSPHVPHYTVDAPRSATPEPVRRSAI